MKSQAKFEKVSFKQFMQDWIKYLGTDYDYDSIKNIYDNIKLPKRSTAKSAGYDFFMPEGFIIDLDSIFIPTGIRCINMADDEVLMIYPRSSLGTKYRITPTNLVGIIDADYADSGNEGHIIMNMVNDGYIEMYLEAGRAFCQGIITRICVTADDSANGVRNGGFGSTDMQD